MLKNMVRRLVLPAAFLAATTLGGCYAYPGYYGYGNGYYAGGPYGYAGYGYPGYVGVGYIRGGWGGYGYGFHGGGWGWHGGYGWRGYGYHGGFGRGGVIAGSHGGVGSPSTWHR